MFGRNVLNLSEKRTRSNYKRFKYHILRPVNRLEKKLWRKVNFSAFMQIIYTAVRLKL